MAIAARALEKSLNFLLGKVILHPVIIEFVKISYLENLSEATLLDQVVVAARVHHLKSGLTICHIQQCFYNIKNHSQSYDPIFTFELQNSFHPIFIVALDFEIS